MSIEPPPLAPEPPPPRRRSAGTWLTLFIIWTIGLIVWAVYIGLLVAIVVRILS
jgi:hypothetical protein